MNKNSNGKRLLDINTEDPSCSCLGRKAPPYFPPLALEVDDKNSLKAPALLKPKPKHPLSPSPSGVVHIESTLSSSASAPAQTNIVDYPFELDSCHRKIDELNKVLDNVINALVASYRDYSNLKDKIKAILDKAGLDAAVVQKLKSDTGLQLRSKYN